MISAKFVSESLGLPGPIPGAGAFASFTSFCTDTRTLTPGSLFIALKGELHDGHDHVDVALAKGAAGILREARPGQTLPAGVVDFCVPDSLAAFRKLIAAWRGTFRIPVLMVAGSVGKTTTKEILAALLMGKHGAQVLKTEFSQNGFMGIPMTLSRLTSAHTAGVIEVGIDDIGAMDEHWDLVQPTAAIVTAIAEEHLEHLIDLETVAREEMRALEKTLSATGRVFVNLDDPRIAEARSRLQGSYVFEFTTDSTLPAGPTRLVGMPSSGAITVNGLGLSSVSFPLPLPGIHNVRNFLGALAMALVEGLTEAEIREGLSHFRPAEGRTNLRRLEGGTLVLADYYNANPASMQAAFEWLDLEWNQSGRRGRKIAILGDMLELGPGEERFHRELADALVRASVDAVFLFGPRMKWLADSLAKTSIPTRHFDTHEALAQAAGETLTANDCLLVKGSRGMKMETVLKFL